LVDPLPAITDLQTPLHSRNSMFNRPRSWGWGGARQTSTLGRSVVSALDIALPMAHRLPFIMPLNKYKANSNQLASLGDSFMTMVSTFDCIRPDESFAPAGDPEASTVISLLRLIKSDTHVLFRSLDWTLDGISKDSQDDYLIARRLSEWRKLMSHFEIAIPAMAKRLVHFSDFIFRPTTENDYPDEVVRVLQAVDNDLASAATKLGNAHADLRADMQFAESRRSITETKTVTRLTELAFVFVPLSFCASLFSMSIKELENGVPVWIFVVTALATIALAYAVRLFLGSELLINSSRRSLQRFWRRTGVKPGADAPMLTIAWYITQDVWNNGGSAFASSIAKLLGLTAMIALPTAFMWTSENMGGSFNAAVTLLVFLGIASTSMMLSAGFKLSAPLAQGEDDHTYTESV
jgi:hypothetical protein